MILPGSASAATVVVAAGAIVAGPDVPDYSAVAGFRRASCAATSQGRG